MKCIYCNSQDNLTSSDIITAAITKTKLTKPFVCKMHNSFTNEKYEQKFVEHLEFFRNYFGFTTRDGKIIKYTSDIIAGEEKIHNVKMSSKEHLFLSQGIIGFNDKKEKVRIAPLEKIKGVDREKISLVDMNNIKVCKNIDLDIFWDYYAIHSIAKMAYEWYCFINNITEYRKEYADIVEFILGNNNNEEMVGIIINYFHYNLIDKLSETCTNLFFQYNEIDGYRYVVFNFWNIVSYRVRICKSSDAVSFGINDKLINIYLYREDGTKDKKAIGVKRNHNNVLLRTISPDKITNNIKQVFIDRIITAMSSKVLSIYNLKRDIDALTLRLKEYDKKRNIDNLIGFGEDNIITVIQIIIKLYLNKNKYELTKSFNHNLKVILNLNGCTLMKNSDDTKTFLNFLYEMHNNNQLSECIWNGINMFNEIYDKETT